MKTWEKVVIGVLIGVFLLLLIGYIVGLLLLAGENR
jgi:hypothetical protein